jgi:hypothetical protein
VGEMEIGESPLGSWVLKKKLNSPAPSLPEEERGAVIAVLNGLYVNRPLVTEALGSSLGCVKLGP